MIILDRGRVLSQSMEETMHLGEITGRALQDGGTVLLVGPLGSGKTCFAKGLARAVEIDPAQVVSPTFILHNRMIGRIPFNHFDAYRLQGPGEFVELGADDFIHEAGSLNCIEWAEKVEECLPKDHLKVLFAHRGEGSREVEFQGSGAQYESSVSRLWKEIESERLP